MLIRHAIKSDLAAVMTILEVGRCRMREAGNATQWADGYPSQAQIMADIEAGCSYIGEEDGRPMVTFACVLGPEPTYHTIYEGAWPNEKPYATVHRMASLPEYRGVFRTVMDYCFRLSPVIRVDTHRDNAPMRHLLTAYLFNFCGIIHLNDGAERLAFIMER